MFCKKCGDEINEYELCAGNVVSSDDFSEYHYFDKNTGEKWFCVGFHDDYGIHLLGAHCDKCNYIVYNSEGGRQISNTNYKSHAWSDENRWFVSEKYCIDDFPVIGTCDRVCCPKCGYGKSSSKKSSSGCFIATAIYGSYNSTEVFILREFRDNFLLTSKAGCLFVKVYYSLSPCLVKLFGSNLFARYIIRNFLLNPFVKYCSKKNKSEKR